MDFPWRSFAKKAVSYEALKHIQPIYEAEMKKGNAVSAVSVTKDWRCKLGVHFVNPLRDDHVTALARQIDHQAGYPVVIRYFCEECGCLLDSPPADQPCGWAPAPNDPRDMRVVATEPTVCLEDAVYGHLIKPIVISEAQKIAYDSYWGAHSDEKAKLQAAGERLRKQYFPNSFDACREANERVYGAVKRLRELETKRASLSVFAIGERRSLLQEERAISEALPSLPPRKKRSTPKSVRSRL